MEKDEPSELKNDPFVPIHRRNNSKTCACTLLATFFRLYSNLSISDEIFAGNQSSRPIQMTWCQNVSHQNKLVVSEFRIGTFLVWSTIQKGRSDNTKIQSFSCSASERQCSLKTLPNWQRWHVVWLLWCDSLWWLGLGHVSARCLLIGGKWISSGIAYKKL